MIEKNLQDSGDEYTIRKWSREQDDSVAKKVTQIMKLDLMGAVEDMARSLQRPTTLMSS